MKCDKKCIFFIIFMFLLAIVIINRFTKLSDRKIRVYVQGAFYIDKDDIYNINDKESINRMFRYTNPDILIVQQPVTFFDNLFDELTDKISPSEKDSAVKVYFEIIEESSRLIGFDIMLLDVWDLDNKQARKAFYIKNSENRDFKLKVDSYKKLNKTITKKINELGLSENIYTINSSRFDELKEVEGEFFASLFSEELGFGDYKYLNKKYIDRIIEIIEENEREKIIIIYDANNKFELIKRLSEKKNMNVIMVKENKKKQK